MNAAKMTLVSTVVAAALGLALGLMSTTAQAHCKRNHQLPHEHCLPSDGTTYTVQLFERDLDTDGAFCLDVFGGLTVCGPVDAIAASNGALLVGDTGFDVLELNRPDDDATWDGVFNTCPGLFEEDSVNDLEVDNWRVKLAGDQVRVQFIRALPLSGTIDDFDVEVTLQLIDRGPYDFDGDDSFLPVSGESKTYHLDNYNIFGSSLKGTHPRLRCDHTGDDTLVIGIDLVIEAMAAAP